MARGRGMAAALLFGALLASGCVAISNWKNYCSLDCRLDSRVIKHVVCSRKGCQFSPSCVGYKRPTNIRKLKNKILAAHNRIRDEVASGDVYELPPAANMRAVNWDNQLQNIAQCWADACEKNKDVCRRTADLHVGQNVAWMSFSASQSAILKDNKALDRETLAFIDEWEEEGVKVTELTIRGMGKYDDGGIELNSEFRIENVTSQHLHGSFTKITWHSVEYIGCARSMWKENNDTIMLFVCNYGSRTESPNTDGLPVYKIGAPCSRCPPDTRCNITGHRSLCGQFYDPAEHQIMIGEENLLPDEPEHLRGGVGARTHPPAVPALAALAALLTHLTPSSLKA